MTVDDRLATAFLDGHPAEAARAVEGLSPADVVALCDRTSPASIAPVLARMDQLLAARVVAELEPQRASDLISALDPTNAGLLMRRLPEATREGILSRVPSRLATRLRDVLHYPPDTAGALCDPGVLTVAADRTVDDALEAVRQAGRAYYYVFVVDRDQRLMGVVNLRDLVSAAATAPVRKIARTDVVRLSAAAKSPAILAHPSWRDLAALPVVDAHGRFLGLLRHETVKRLESEAATRPMNQSVAALLLDLGELFWTTGGEVMGELSGVLAPSVQAPRKARADD